MPNRQTSESNKVKLSVYFRWISHSLCAISDQAFFAVANFALNILLVRWLSPHDYGEFSVVLAIHVLIGACHSTLFTEPMLVYGSEKYKENLSAYIGWLLYGHAAFSLLTGLLIISIAIGLISIGQQSFAMCMGFLAISSPIILLYWILRRAPYIVFRPQMAAIGSLMYCLITVISVFSLFRNEMLNSTTGLLTMGLASIFPSLWIVYALKIQRPPLRHKPFPLRMLRDHLAYGRWAFSTGLCIWISGNIYYVLLPIWGGLEASAALRSMFNLTMPILQINGALAGLLVPQFIKVKHEVNFSNWVWSTLGLFTLGSALYWLALGMFGPIVIEYIYDGQFLQYANFLWIVGLYPILSGAISVLGSLLRAMERPDLLFWSYLASAGVVVTFGIGAMKIWGLWGVGISLVCSYSLATALLVWCTWNYLHYSEQPKVLRESF